MSGCHSNQVWAWIFESFNAIIMDHACTFVTYRSKKEVGVEKNSIIDDVFVTVFSLTYHNSKVHL